MIPVHGSLTDAAKSLGQHASSGASSSLVDAVSRSGSVSNKGNGVSGAMAALPPSVFLDDAQHTVSKTGVQDSDKCGAVAISSRDRQLVLEGSYDLDASGDIVHELDESVEEADESDEEHKIEDIVAQRGAPEEEPEVSIDYDDLGDVSPPESIDAADGMDFELEGASLDDEDFELDTEDVF